ncbi:hypothetical protein [Pseudarthrobacter sp. BIM B-2242]|uniref:hypothetical protein n=1 Tax=Pseudarthrobacter sp. BIM B-2242 TaxID=2772401 RepID=UPI00168BE705|nr:hypothetical protein [Pseudarthrobacter sp. BIM B-2242]QOD06100.1 hypothetical protein IDT60_21300 [Pseudarthrobacter sp. BIM B-2242]
MSLFLVMTLALFGLAAARVKPLRANGRDDVFAAAMFAGVSTLLVDTRVYFVVDQVLGGVNVTKLLINSLMVVGLWYLHCAALSAMSPADTRPAWLRTMPLWLNLALQPVFFVLAGLTPTNPVWTGTHPNRIASALFSMLTLIFIAWACGKIAWVCLRYVPRMRQSFRVGFSMVGLGCALTLPIMAEMILGEIHQAFPSAPSALGLPTHLLEMIAIVLVGVGLTIPPVAGRISTRRTSRRLEEALIRVAAIRDKTLQVEGGNRSLLSTDHDNPHENLHRMIVEIWDAELAAGRNGSRLSTEDRDYMLLVESELGRVL